MAFGSLKGSIGGAGASIASTTTTITASAGISVAVGDAVVAAFSERTTLEVSGCVDDLGNTYTAQNAGTDAGTNTGRAFYFIVTSAGTLNSLSFGTSTVSGNDYAAVAQVIEGPFSSAIGATSSNVAGTTLPQAANSISPPSSASVLVSWLAACNGAGAGPATCATGYSIGKSTFSGTGGANTAGAAIAYKAVTSTASDTPTWSSTGSATASIVVGGMSFSGSTGSAPPAAALYRMFAVF